MVEGLGKGAGLALLAVPMADAFIFSQAQFQRILSNYLGLEGEKNTNTIFTPIVMSACGAMGPSMMAFLKEVYGRAKGADKFLMH